MILIIPLLMVVVSGADLPAWAWAIAIGLILLDAITFWVKHYSSS